VQREARRDIDRSKAVLVGILVGGGLGLALIFFKAIGLMAGVVPVGLTLAFLFPIWGFLRKQEETPAPPSTPSPSGSPARSAPVASRSWTCASCGSEVEANFDACWNCTAPRSLKGKGTAAPARSPSSPAPVEPSSPRPAGKRGDAIESGCIAVLKVLGAIAAVLAGLVLVGFLILWIVCLNTSW